jgi:hypothetical protein
MRVVGNGVSGLLELAGNVELTDGPPAAEDRSAN